MDAFFYCSCQFVACKSILNVPKSLTTATSISFYYLSRKKILTYKEIWHQIFCSFFLQKPKPVPFRIVTGVFRHTVSRKQSILNSLLRPQIAQLPNKDEL